MELPKFTDRNVLAFAIGGVALFIGILAGISASTTPLLLAALVLLAVIAFFLIYFFTNFEIALLSTLILRSALDPFPPLPALFAIGIDVLAAIYIGWMLVTRQPVLTNRFWWFLLGWVLFQLLWVILLPLGGLGIEGGALMTGVREWTRLFTWVAVYLLVMQLKGRIPPEKMITLLFISTVIPLTVAFLQLVVPSALPANLINEGAIESRINGTLGHPATFSTFLLLFINLTLWKLGHTRHRSYWLVLLGTFGFFLVGAQSLTSFLMLAVMLAFLVAPRLNVLNVLGSLIFGAIIIGLLLSTDLGRERVASVLDTPLLNPDIDWSRSVLLSWRDGNSFNWRVAQWTFLLRRWQDSPLLGYGLNTSPSLTVLSSYAHNDYVRFLVEQGIVGFLGLLTFLGGQVLYLVKFMVDSPKGSPKGDLSFFLLAFLVAMIVGMSIENIWTHTTLFFYWWIMFAVLSWDWPESLKRRPEPVGSP